MKCISSIGEYEATACATINANFIGGITGIPYDLAYIAAVPEPSSLLLVAAATGIGVALRRRRRCAMH